MSAFERFADNFTPELLADLEQKRIERQSRPCEHLWSGPLPYFKGGHWRVCHLCQATEDVPDAG